MTRAPTSLIAALAVALALGACSPAPSPTPSISSTSGPTDGATAAPTNAAASIVRAYFFVGSLVENGGLVPVERIVSAQEAGGPIERAALEALLAGPAEAEMAASPALYSVMPQDTRVLGLELGTDGAATVDLSAEFESAGSANAKGRLAQVVFTLTQFPGITDVRFKIAGTPITSFSDAQLPLEPPVDRSDFTDQLPVIFLDQPAWGATLGNPAHITGLSDAFEAQFLVRILDAAGQAIAERSVMASCGSGCWGTFDESIPYPAAVAGAGRVQAYELSEMDGSIVSLTDYPVVLGQ